MRLSEQARRFSRGQFRGEINAPTPGSVLYTYLQTRNWWGRVVQGYQPMAQILGMRIIGFGGVILKSLG